MLVVDTGVHHGDVDVGTGETEVPCTHWIETGVAGFDGRRLNVAVEHDVAVALDHDHVLKRCELSDHTDVQLTQKDCVYRFNDVDHAEFQGLELSEMVLGDLSTVGQTDTGDALKGLQAVVDTVSVLVE